MIPITAGILGGAGATGRSRGRTLALTLVYVLGLALVYSVLGLLAGLSGTLFGSVRENGRPRHKAAPPRAAAAA